MYQWRGWYEHKSWIGVSPVRNAGDVIRVTRREQEAKKRVGNPVIVEFR